jgi:hypothetical protein
MSGVGQSRRSRHPGVSGSPQEPPGGNASATCASPYWKRTAPLQSAFAATHSTAALLAGVAIASAQDMPGGKSGGGAQSGAQSERGAAGASDDQGRAGQGQRGAQDQGKQGQSQQRSQAQGTRRASGG